MNEVIQVSVEYEADVVVRDAAAAARRLDVALLKDAEPLADFDELFPSLAAAGIRVGRIYVLALLAQEQSRDDVSLLVHDLDASPDAEETFSLRYNLARDDVDPCSILATAVMKLATPGNDPNDIRSDLALETREAVRIARHRYGDDGARASFQRMADLFALDTSPELLLDYGSMPDVRLADALVAAMAERLAEVGRVLEAGAPKP